MRTVPPAIAAARQTATTRLCKIWRIERTDGKVLCLTEHDRDLTIDGEVYRSTASFDPSTIKTGADLSVDDLDVAGAFDTDLISVADLFAGRYYGATFTVAEVLWDDLGAGRDVLRWGRIGTVKETGGKFLAELLGPTWRLQQPMGKVYSAGCRAVLGDALCRVDLTSHTHVVTIVEVVSRSLFRVVGLPPPPMMDGGYYSNGRVTFEGDSPPAANDGLSMEVLDSDGQWVQLFLSMPYHIEVGATVTVVAGCDHSRLRCLTRFDNVLNFQGEPDAPISDDIIRGPGGGEGAEGSASSTPPADLGDDDDGSP